MYRFFNAYKVRNTKKNHTFKEKIYIFNTYLPDKYQIFMLLDKINTKTIETMVSSVYMNKILFRISNNTI